MVPHGGPHSFAIGADMGCHHLVVNEHIHHAIGEAHQNFLAAETVRNRVIGPIHAHVAIRVDLGLLPSGHVKRL